MLALLATLHTFAVDAFRFESGVTVPHVQIEYATFGRLNAERSNAVLAPSHFMIDQHGYDWLLGPGQALDTTRYFVITTEMFGNGRSSSPSNTPEPFHGPRFPAVTIRDNVRMAHAVLVDSLHLTHLAAIVGFSMGAEQAFQWAISYPDFADRIVVTSGTAKTYPHTIVMLEGAVSALGTDAAFRDGDYTTEPTRGIHAFGVVWAGWLYSQAWWRGRSVDSVLGPLAASFMRYDANDLISQARTMQRNDISNGGDIEGTLRTIRVPVLYMPAETDLYVPIGDARYEAQFIPQVTFTPIPSLWGHPAGAGASPTDSAFTNRAIARFLTGLPHTSHQR
jgi:homoserine O-acetyltransferase/O-succinyltransferase